MTQRSARCCSALWESSLAVQIKATLHLHHREPAADALRPIINPSISEGENAKR